jgi:hypothetical protein
VSTWTVPFTDIVASTTTRVRVGEDAFDAVRAETTVTFPPTRSIAFSASMSRPKTSPHRPEIVSVED